MLDLILFVLAMTLGTESETDYAVAAPAGEDVAAIAEEIAPQENMADAPVENAPEDMVEEMAEVAADDASEDVTEEVADAAAEAVVEEEAREPETPGGGSWNIETANNGSWITNAPEGTGTDSGTSLLAGLALSDDETKPAAPTFEAEPQIATGKFTTATEVKPILEATKGSWVAVRDYEGKDWLYVTHIWSWRCGLHQMRYSINGGPMQVWPLPPCHEGTNAPNAIIESDGLPYATYGAGEIQSITVELLLDDMSEASAQYIRADVLMP